ncbi:hypothetical protein BJ170DRAFT_179722 [Xylariales sp. AK1849]|nr:hypothetical protein BJ170DRAFT_179722 [Xylariales sp. AK1849]
MMRHRDMIIDNYASAGGDPKTLKYLGVMSIDNEFARDAAKAEFVYQEKDYLSACQVEITPGSYTFAGCILENPFVSSHVSLARDLGGEVQRIVFISEGFGGPGKPGAWDPKLHMMIELDRKAVEADEASEETPGLFDILTYTKLQTLRTQTQRVQAELDQTIKDFEDLQGLYQDFERRRNYDERSNNKGVEANNM